MSYGDNGFRGNDDVNPFFKLTVVSAVAIAICVGIALAVRAVQLLADLGR